MTTDMKALMNYSWMSQAAYRGFSGIGAGDGPAFQDALISNADIGKDKKFAAKQADIFTDTATGFSFQHHQPNIAGNGFSATVFKSNETGAYTIAVRGTEPNRTKGVSID